MNDAENPPPRSPPTSRDRPYSEGVEAENAVDGTISITGGIWSRELHRQYGAQPQERAALQRSRPGTSQADAWTCLIRERSTIQEHRLRTSGSRTAVANAASPGQQQVITGKRVGFPYPRVPFIGLFVMCATVGPWQAVAETTKPVAVQPEKLEVLRHESRQVKEYRPGGPGVGPADTRVVLYAPSRPIEGDKVDFPYKFCQSSVTENNRSPRNEAPDIGQAGYRRLNVDASSSRNSVTYQIWVKPDRTLIGPEGRWVDVTLDVTWILKSADAGTFASNCLDDRATQPPMDTNPNNDPPVVMNPPIGPRGEFWVYAKLNCLDIEK